MNNNRIYVDLHVLQTVPPSCVNRDDTGSPKTAVYGGVNRARVSSQAWKRAMRTYFAEVLLRDDVGYLTKNVLDLLSNEIMELRPEYKKGKAKEIAIDVLNAAGITYEKKGSEHKTKALFFISPAQIHALAEIAVRPENQKTAEEEYMNALMLMPGADLLLFGRMVASGNNNNELNYDAAAQVAHAISTHEVENEFDFFTAKDDWSPYDKVSTAHMGVTEFNSSTLYRYATVNVTELEKKLGEGTPEVVKAFAEAFIHSMPTGKQNTFANWTRPDAVYVTVRRDQPINMAGAFEAPVRADGRGYIQGSVERLVQYAKDTYENFASDPALALTVGKGMERLAEPCSVNSLLDALEAYIKGDGAQE